MTQVKTVAGVPKSSKVGTGVLGSSDSGVLGKGYKTLLLDWW